MFFAGGSVAIIRAASLRRTVEHTRLMLAEVVQFRFAPSPPPDLEDVFCTDIGVKLMRIGLDIAMDIFDHFARQGIPCLGVHDSFIVPAKYERELQQVMTDSYVKRLGQKPVLK